MAWASGAPSTMTTRAQRPKVQAVRTCSIGAVDQDSVRWNTLAGRARPKHKVLDGCSASQRAPPHPLTGKRHAERESGGGGQLTAHGPGTMC